MSTRIELNWQRPTGTAGPRRRGPRAVVGAALSALALASVLSAAFLQSASAGASHGGTAPATSVTLGALSSSAVADVTPTSALFVLPAITAQNPAPRCAHRARCHRDRGGPG